MQKELSQSLARKPIPLSKSFFLFLTPESCIDQTWLTQTRRLNSIQFSLFMHGDPVEVFYYLKNSQTTKPASFIQIFKVESGKNPIKHIYNLQ